jgi:hypothetical protein
VLKVQSEGARLLGCVYIGKAASPWSLHTIIMKALVLLFPLVGLSVASSQQQQTLVPDYVPPPQPYCVDRPPQGQCYTAEVCSRREPSGQRPCDYYTVTYDKNRTPLNEKCEMDPKRPRCGKQADGLTCDPQNGWGTCCSGDG